MARLQIRVDNLNLESYFRCPRTGIMYRRVAAGMAWPESGREGAAIVLGETRSKQNFHLNNHHDLHVLEEVRTDSMPELIDAVVRMTADWYVKRWSLPTCDGRMYLLDDINDILRRERKPVIRYGDPEGWEGKGEGQVKFYHAFVEMRTKEEKTLFFHGATAADEIRQMDANQGLGGQSDADKRPTIFPGAAALFFAVAEIDMQLRKEAHERREYDFGPCEQLGGY